MHARIRRKHRDMADKEAYERSNDHPSLGRCAREAHATVIFIEDSATMREVIKIAFRRERHQHRRGAPTPLPLWLNSRRIRPMPSSTDVIMPDQDGYCLHADQAAPGIWRNTGHSKVWSCEQTVATKPSQ